MVIACASDHAGLELKRAVMDYLDEIGIAYKDFGTYTEDSCNYPEYALKAANAVVSGECDKGILCCGTGVGIGIAANKVKGIRCVICSDCYSAKLSGQHNNTNMLAMGGRVVGTEYGKMIVESWLSGEFMGGKHAKRVDMITSIEQYGEIR